MSLIMCGGPHVIWPRGRVRGRVRVRVRARGRG